MLLLHIFQQRYQQFKQDHHDQAIDSFAQLRVVLDDLLLHVLSGMISMFEDHPGMVVMLRWFLPPAAQEKVQSNNSG